MQKSWPLLATIGVIILALIAVLSLGRTAPEDDVEAAGQIAAAPDADHAGHDHNTVAAGDTVADPIDENQPDPFIVPDGDAEALMQYINDLQALRPTATSQLEMLEHMKKTFAAQIAAAEKILAGEATIEQAEFAVGTKIQLHMLQENRLGDETAGEKWRKFAEEIRKDPRPEIADVALQFIFVDRLMKWAQNDDDQKSAFIADLVEYLGTENLDDDRVQLAQFVAQQLETIQEESSAAKLYEALVAGLKNSPESGFASQVTRLEGFVRRLNLMGNSMDIEGTLLDGSAFDWSSYEGKVVLVDFWATWCGPCIVELPNVIENYEQYHDKGFEVVGISIDNEKAPVDKFVADRKLPWSILYNDDPDATGWSNPMAVRYGITGIPAAYLIDQEGKVVTLLARGPYLGEHLEALLGKAEPSTSVR